MKRLLNLRNTVTIALVFSGFMLVTSAFTFGPVEDAQLAGNEPQKKEQRVKVVVNVDGKQTKIDTVFNLPDEKMINEKIDSMMSNLDKEGMGHHRNRMMFKNDRALKVHFKGNKHNPGDEQFDIFIQNGDSDKMGKERKVICVRGFENDNMKEEDENDELMPPPPPMPPHAQMMFHNRFGGDSYAFDTKDESVVSYEKKDIGDGLEKITIVRKKHDQHKETREIKVKAEVSDAQMNKKKSDEAKALKKLKDEADAAKNDKK